MKFFRAVLLLLVVIVLPLTHSHASKSDSVFTIRESKDFFPLNKASYFLKDSTGKLSINQILKLETSFSPIEDEMYNVRRDKNVRAYWIRCSIQNLTLDRLKYLLCFHSGVDTVETFVFHADSTKNHLYIRSLQPARSRPLFIGQELVIPLELQQGGTLVYIRIANQSLWSREMGSIIISLAEEKGFVNYFLEARFFQGVILGMLLLILLFHIFVYLFFKDTTYLIFVVNVFFTLLYLLLRKNYQMEFEFPPSIFSILTYLHDPIGVLIGITAIWFSQSFLNTRQTDAVVHKIMNVLMIAQGVVIVNMIFLQFLALTNLLSICLAFVSALVVIVASIRSYLRGNRLAIYVFFGFVLLGAVPVIYLIPLPNYLHYKTSESDFHYFGEAIRSIIFAIGIADRFYQLKRDVARVEMEKKQLELEKEKQLQEEKERISRDLHDNIGSQMAVLSLELSNPALNLSNQHQLAAARENINHIILQLRDTVWALESTEVSFEDIENRINAMIFSFRKKVDGIEFKLELHESLQRFLLKPSQAINLYRIVQEAVQNAIRHGQGSFVHVHFAYDEHSKKMIVKVIDDGVGFPNSNQVDGEMHYGIKNIKKRAREINGILQIKPGEPKGVVVELIFPVS